MKLRAGLVLLVGVLIAADAKDDATKKDVEKIQGTWNAVAAERGGEKAPKEVLGKLRHIFKGNKLIMALGEGTFKLDATKEPKTIDMIMKDGQKEETALGIYQLQGDELKICAENGAKERPKEFKTTKGSRAAMLTFKREKK